MRSRGVFVIMLALAGLAGCKSEEAAEQSLLRIGTVKRSEVGRQTASRGEVLYLEKPAECAPNSECVLYKLDGDERYAQQAKVLLGAASNGFVEVGSGLNVGDKVILSDMSAWKSRKRIRLQR